MRNRLSKISLLFCFVFVCIGCQGVNQITQEIMQRPYWSLTEIIQDGKEVAIKFETGFTLYTEGRLSGHFPINSFSGGMFISEEGKVTFGEVMWTEMAGEQEPMQEELLLQKVLFTVTHAKVENNTLTMSDEKQLTLKFTPSDFAYLKNLQEKTWELVGIEEEDTGLGTVVAYKDPNEQYKNLDTFVEKINLKCSKEYSYDKDSNSIVYNISGNLEENSYTAKLKISKNTGRMSVSNLETVSTNAVDAKFIAYLSKWSNLSYIHDNLHLNADNVLMVFRSMK